MKSVAITGAGSGLGLALSKSLAGEGYRVFMLGRNEAKLQSAAEQVGANAQAIVCDITDPDSVDRAFDTIAQSGRPLDVLINNAGVYRPFYLDEATNAEIAEALNINLAGPMFCSRSALRNMERGGHILCIGSETAVEKIAMLGGYQAAKAGLERYCKTLDQELAPRGVRVTLVRAGKMFGPEMDFVMDLKVAARFSEENKKPGYDNGSSAISLYASAAQAILALLHLPADINVPEIVLAGRHA